MATALSLSSASPPRLAAPSRLAWPLLLLGVVAAAACLPLLKVHAWQIWMRPYYQFLPLLPVGAAVLLWQRLRGGVQLAPGSTGVAVALFAGVWIALAVAELLYSSWLAAVAGMVLLAALPYAAGGRPLLTRVLPAWTLLCLAVPPPFELDRELVLWLQRLTAQWSSQVLDLLGAFHVMAGNVVEINGRRLLVEESCSGINSLFSVFACTLFFVLLTRRPWVRSLLLLASAIAWVLAANVARVVLVAYSTTRWGFDLTESGRHETLGLFLFGLALLLIASTDQLLAFLLVPAGGPAARGRNAVFDATTEASADSSSGQPRRWLVAWPFTVAFAALLAVHVASYGVASDAATLTGVPVAAAVEGLGEDSFPNELAGWKQQGFKIEQRSAGSSFGECSREWTYMRGGNLAVISLDYPFPGWHDLTRCYTGQGWAMDEEVIRQARTDGETLGEAFVAVRLTKPGYRSGYLLFWQCDPSGTPLEARRGAAYLAAYRHASLWRRWLDRAQGRPAPPALPSTVYQCQLFLETNAPPTPVEQAEVEQLFLEAVKALRRSWQPDPSPAQHTAIPAENHNQ